MTLPFSQACENNKDPILAVLKSAFADRTHVLEVGSGTGQHAVYFTEHLPHLIWQTSDLPANHEGINSWIDAKPSDNLKRPIDFDLNQPIWPEGIDAAYSANTAHIVSWPLVQNLFSQVGENLPVGGVFALYGPFNYQGKFTSESNAAFDQMLRERDPNSGIRHFEEVVALAETCELMLNKDNPMPANNRLLVFVKIE
ncbi:DUF938 domain-containing protein [Gilvimarinus sp. SDUM040013]|uniref:DUF938 domain-containing protein n=1 Tax=Gilvimarinus gilvus TaxID=3058038 RepID=A0ABU4S188_9GAMM|nr:DUF938 domain-containing protein [Gilvimarinus sp. SDUM040013]MDO3385357.1 DUF938 domain-containing protein [Gilvimarinus sp. SDUM040013]MDX6850932.1 DUF938 domain-containing protein [Gilvimarinus sp. SDUM040013]